METWYTTEGKFMVNSPYGVQDFTSLMSTIEVAIDGSDIYIKGLAYYFRDGWIKGTINEHTATFANGQVVGEDEYGVEYFCGSDDTKTLVENIVFNYNAEEGLMESETLYLLENNNATEPSPYSYWYKPSFSKTEPSDSKLVVLPEGVLSEDWVITYDNNMDVPSSSPLKIAFYGSDVYLQGLNSFLPEAWIKGSLDGTTITFPGRQYFGFHQDTPYSGYDMFLQEEDVVFTYDAAENKMTAVTKEITIHTSTLLKADIYKNAVITKVIEKATTPATPNITQIYDSSEGPVVLFTVPVVDVDGNGMVSSKLTFQLLSDTEEEITPVTFDPADYGNLTEAMTIFPYGFSDNTELFPTYFYLKQANYSKWNKLGIQSIYTGGGEENKSEIFWYTIKEYQKVTFDFNAMTDEPCSSNDSNAGDITEDRQLKEGNVTLTISPNPEGTPNRFWNSSNGPQLRVYGGTLTFEAAVGKTINKIVFNSTKWNDNSADTGTFDGKTWTGEAQKVVVTIAGNTQLNSIVVIPSDYVPTAIVAPENLVTDTYIMKANSVKPYYEPAELTLWLKVGFDGDDAYIQGLAADANSSADQLWVKATKNKAGQYVIPANQFMGNVSFWMSNNDYYFTALDTDGKMVDAVLDYDAEKSVFSTSQPLVLNALPTDVYAYQTFTDVTISKFDEVAASPANPTIKSIDFGEWSSGISCLIPAVSSNGETLNPQKLFYTVWIEKDGLETPYVFKAEMYYGVEEDATEVPYSFNYSTWDGSHNIYFQDGVEVCGKWAKVGIQSIYYGGDECNKSAVAWIDNPNASAINDIKADIEAGKAVFFNIAGQRLDAPQKGLNIINGHKVVIK